MKRWWVTIALLLSLGVNLGLLASRALDRRDADRSDRPQPTAERPLPSFPGDIPPPLERLADRLELTGEPRERFLALQTEMFRTATEARQRRRELQRRLRQELVAEEPDRERVEEILDEVARTQRALEGTFVRTVLDSRELLRPEQQRRYLGFVSRLRQHAGEDPQGPPGRRFPRRRPGGERP